MGALASRKRTRNAWVLMGFAVVALILLTSSRSSTGSKSGLQRHGVGLDGNSRSSQSEHPAMAHTYQPHGHDDQNDDSEKQPPLSNFLLIGDSGMLRLFHRTARRLIDECSEDDTNAVATLVLATNMSTNSTSRRRFGPLRGVTSQRLTPHQVQDELAKLPSRVREGPGLIAVSIPSRCKRRQAKSSSTSPKYRVELPATLSSRRVLVFSRALFASDLHAALRLALRGVGLASSGSSDQHVSIQQDTDQAAGVSRNLRGGIGALIGTGMWDALRPSISSHPFTWPPPRPVFEGRAPVDADWNTQMRVMERAVRSGAAKAAELLRASPIRTVSVRLPFLPNCSAPKFVDDESYAAMSENEQQQRTHVTRQVCQSAMSTRAIPALRKQLLTGLQLRNLAGKHINGRGGQKQQSAKTSPWDVLVPPLCTMADGVHLDETAGCMGAEQDALWEAMRG